MRKILSLILGLLWASPAFALPTGYTELEYIEGTGTQYITTDITANQDTSAEIKFVPTSVYPSNAVFGARTSKTSDAFNVWLPGVDGGIVSNLGTLGAVTTNTEPILNEVYVMYLSKTRFAVNNLVTNISNVTDFVTPGGIQIFNIYGGAATVSASATSTNRIASGKVYYFKIWQNNTLTHNFIPAKNASGVVGMYDTVGNRFYTNAGTGEFVAGDPVVDNSCRNLFDKDTADANRIYGFFQQTGTSWTWAQNGFSVRIPCKPNTTYTARYNGNDTQVVLGFGSTNNDDIPPSGTSVSVTQGIRQNNPTINTPVTLTTGPNDKWLIVAYNVAEPQHSDMANNLQIEEGDTATAYVPYCEKIKIATTKYNETAFSPLNTALANAISVVDSVVSNTITQAGRIATLQTQKQTRPNDIADDNEKCPAGKKCLLVEDASGVPHWYEIVERYSLLPDGYTELEYIESTGTQYLDLDTGTQTGVFKIIADVYAAGSTDWQYLFGYAKDGGGSPLGVWVSKNQIKETFAAGNGNVIADVNKWEHIDITNSNTVTIPDFYIFHVNPTGITSYTINPGRIKYLQLKKDGDTIRDMVSAKRNSDGAIGMYDTVNNRFYTNAGTGEFIPGDPVSE